MRRVTILCGITLLVLTVTGNVRADWHSFWHRVHLDFHRNNCWPEPFIYADRVVTRAPINIMMDNGWRLNNTITHQLFSKETQQLTNAGEMKVRWILTQAPNHRRTVFVLRGNSPEQTAARLESVQAFASGVVPEGHAEVLLTDVIPRGGSGAILDRVSNSYESSAPAPRLPELDNSGGGGN